MIDVDKIKTLREKTGAGIAQCREALDATKGDSKNAEEWLLEKGILKAAKKAERETTQGVVEAYVHGAGKIGVLVEVACETDFVAKTDDFKALAHELAMQVSAMNPKNDAELLKQPYIRDPKLTVDALIKATIAKLGENIRVKHFVRMELGEE